MNKRLVKIDGLTIRDHCHIREEDDCYYMETYDPHSDISDPTKSMINNIKKGNDLKGKPHYKYKEKSMRDCANKLKQTNFPNLFSDDITIVPIPPSKSKDDPLYDGRLVKILEYAFGCDIDVRELVLQRESRESAHKSEERRDIDKIKDNYYIDEDLSDNLGDILIVFDDVLTTGALSNQRKKQTLTTFQKQMLKSLMIHY